jgi:uncharacterized protein YheU (UPF0270 family)
VQDDLLEIPYRELSPEALRGVLEEYATRGGFESDMSLDTRIEEIKEKLKAGKARIIFDPKEGTTNLVTG